MSATSRTLAVLESSDEDSEDSGEPADLNYDDQGRRISWRRNPTAHPLPQQQPQQQREKQSTATTQRGRASRAVGNISSNTREAASSVAVHRSPRAGKHTTLRGTVTPGRSTQHRSKSGVDAVADVAETTPRASGDGGGAGRGGSGGKGQGSSPGSTPWGASKRPSPPPPPPLPTIWSQPKGIEAVLGVAEDEEYYPHSMTFGVAQDIAVKLFDEILLDSSNSTGTGTGTGSSGRQSSRRRSPRAENSRGTGQHGYHASANLDSLQTDTDRSPTAERAASAVCTPVSHPGTANSAHNSPRIAPR